MRKILTIAIIIISVVFFITCFYVIFDSIISLGKQIEEVGLKTLTENIWYGKAGSPEKEVKKNEGL